MVLSKESCSSLTHKKGSNNSHNVSHKTSQLLSLNDKIRFSLFGPHTILYVTGCVECTVHSVLTGLTSLYKLKTNILSIS